MAGRHNQANTLAAFAAAHHVGVAMPKLIEALAGFHSVKRRLEKIGAVRGVAVYAAFAHHPTALATTIAALRRPGPGRILALLEHRSTPKRLRKHAPELAGSRREPH